MLDSGLRTQDSALETEIVGANKATCESWDPEPSTDVFELRTHRYQVSARIHIELG